MKKNILTFTITLLALAALLLGLPGHASAQVATPTSTPTQPPAPTAIEIRTATPEPDQVFSRPVVVISSYSLDREKVRPGLPFELRLTFVNNGGSEATNIIAVFESTAFLPQETGGVRTIAWIPPSGDRDMSQPMLASAELWGQSVATVTVRVTYTDTYGANYSESFTLSINVEQPNWVTQPTATPTAINVVRPQLVIDEYTASEDPLQPGTMFNLNLKIRNLGNANAKGVTMVLGGGTIPDNGQGTPQAGVSGSGSDLSTFAPLGSSNLMYLGDLEMTKTISIDPRLIVNVSANPSAYPFKVSFIYNDEKGTRIVDDQIITLLVYSLPVVDVSFYQDPGFFSANMPSILPIQVTNLGRKSAVLGSLKVTANDADITNNVALVGALEPGGYFTLDVNYMPFVAGPQDLDITISYTDDFNQPRTINQTLSIEVMEAPEIIEPEVPLGPDGLPLQPEPVEETLGSKLLRILKGLIGLDSGAPEPVIFPTNFEEEMPVVVPGPKG